MEMKAEPDRLRKRTDVVVFGVSAACLLLYYAPVFRSLYLDWMLLPDFSHGFLIPLVSMYFIWLDRKALGRLPVSPSKAGLPVLLFAFLLNLFGVLSAESFSTRVSLLFALAGLVLFLLGWRQLRRLLFPLCYLMFMIPIPSIILGKITFPLQLFVSFAATKLLLLFGAPVVQDGNIIHLSSVSLQVVEACSGIRSLISLLALGTAFAFLMIRSWRFRVLLVLSCFPIAILLNVLRVFINGLLAHRWGERALQGAIHESAGVLVFVIALGLLFVLWIPLARIERRGLDGKPAAGGRQARAGSADGGTSCAPMVHRKQAAARLVVVLALLAGAVAAGQMVLREERPLDRRGLDTFPRSVGDWVMVDESRIDEESMAVLLVDDYLLRCYMNDREEFLWLYIGYYDRQMEGKQVHSPRQCLRGYGWTPKKKSVSPIRIGGSESRDVLINTDLMTNGTEREFYYWWYQGRGRIYPGEYMNKFYLLWDSIRRHRTDGALVRINMEIRTTAEEADEGIRGFISAVGPLLEEFIPN